MKSTKQSIRKSSQSEVATLRRHLAASEHSVARLRQREVDRREARRANRLTNMVLSALSSVEEKAKG